MAFATKPTAIASHVSEVLEVAQSILRRHQDDDLAEKAFVLQEFWELQKRNPELDTREALNNALADLTAAVHLHLNAELAAVTTAFDKLYPTSGEDRPSRRSLVARRRPLSE